MATVRQELEARLATFAASQVPSLPVAWEGVPFVKPTTAWLECYLASAGTLSVTVDASRNRERGTLSVNVWVPSGWGVGKADALSQAVVRAFKVVPKQGSVSIEAPGNTGKIMMDVAGWIAIPISFPYRYESVA